MIRKGIISGACLNHVITSHYITLLNIIIYYVTVHVHAKRAEIAYNEMIESL